MIDGATDSTRLKFVVRIRVPPSKMYLKGQQYDLVKVHQQELS